MASTGMTTNVYWAWFFR